MCSIEEQFDPLRKIHSFNEGFFWGGHLSIYSSRHWDTAEITQRTSSNLCYPQSTYMLGWRVEVDDKKENKEGSSLQIMIKDTKKISRVMGSN